MANIELAARLEALLALEGVPPAGEVGVAAAPPEDAAEDAPEDAKGTPV